MQKDMTTDMADSSSLSAAFGVIIANPVAGSFQHHTHQLDETVEFLQRHGWKVELRYTKAAGDARELAREAVKQKADIVIAAGGDGTINEIIQELAGSETALSVLPTGTVNVWAREMSIPLDNAGARNVLIHGQTRNVDLGFVNGRYFLLMAGIGFDGEVTYAVQNKPIKRLGVLGYLLMGTWVGVGFHAFQAFLQMNGREVKTNALQIIIGNTQLYGGAIKYTWQAKCDDGLLDICVVHQQSIFRRLLVSLDFLLRRKQRHRWVSYEKSTSVEVRTRRPVAIQIDGEPAGHTPVSISVVPGALKVVVPRKTPEGVFS